MTDELEAIRARHVELHAQTRLARMVVGDDAICEADDEEWPCDTAQVLARLDAAEARVAALREALERLRAIEVAARRHADATHAEPSLWIGLVELRALLAEPPGRPPGASGPPRKGPYDPDRIRERLAEPPEAT